MLFSISTLVVAQKVAEEAAKPDPLIGIVVGGVIVLFGILTFSPLLLGGKKKF